MFSIPYKLNDADVDVEFQFWPGYEATWDEPGCADEYEIQAVIFNGINIISCLSSDDIGKMYDYVESQPNDQDI